MTTHGSVHEQVRACVRSTDQIADDLKSASIQMFDGVEDVDLSFFLQCTTADTRIVMWGYSYLVLYTP